MDSTLPRSSKIWKEEQRFNSSVVFKSMLRNVLHGVSIQKFFEIMNIKQQAELCKYVNINCDQVILYGYVESEWNVC